MTVKDGVYLQKKIHITTPCDATINSPNANHPSCVLYSIYQ